MKQRLRATHTPNGQQYPWPTQGNIDCDYKTGRDLTGEWVPMPSMEQRDNYDAPLAGSPKMCTWQMDMVLAAQKTVVK